MRSESIYTEVTEKILRDMEKGVRPWVKPWSEGNLPGQQLPLRACGLPYQGINILLLWMVAMERGYSASHWMTYKQAKDLGGQVMRGEKSCRIVYAGAVEREEEKNGESVTVAIPFLKNYAVFNAEQIEGLPEQFYSKPVAVEKDSPEAIEAAENFVHATGANIRQGATACYNVVTDLIKIPPRESFHDKEGYYATLLHELSHWTRHKSRLNRDFGRKRWGDEGYAMEELVAELSSAFLCASLGITPIVREDHAAYLSSWLKVLRGDKRAIFTAAAQAQKAVGYLYGFSEKKEQVA